MAADLEVRRKRLRFRCHHMGTAENDVLFGRFADACLPGLDAGQLQSLETLLQENDNDLFLWVTGKEPVPEHLRSDVMDLLIRTNQG